MEYIIHSMFFGKHANSMYAFRPLVSLFCYLSLVSLSVGTTWNTSSKRSTGCRNNTYYVYFSVFRTFFSLWNCRHRDWLWLIKLDFFSILFCSTGILDVTLIQFFLDLCNCLKLGDFLQYCPELFFILILECVIIFFWSLFLFFYWYHSFSPTVYGKYHLGSCSAWFPIQPFWFLC